jgi:hypothetical protein
MISTDKALVDAIQSKQNTIEIEGDLAEHVAIILSTKTIPWSAALVSITVALSAFVTSAGTAAPVSGVVGSGAAAILGLKTTLCAIDIALEAKGVGVLNRLREYKVVKKEGSTIFLQKY